MSIEVTFWNSAGYSAPLPLPQAPAYQQVSDGIAGTIGVAYTQGATLPLTAFDGSSYPSLNYPGYPAGNAPDSLDTGIFGTNEQSPFYTSAGPNTIRVYTPYDDSVPARTTFNWNICKYSSCIDWLLRWWLEERTRTYVSPPMPVVTYPKTCLFFLSLSPTLVSAQTD